MNQRQRRLIVGGLIIGVATVGLTAPWWAASAWTFAGGNSAQIEGIAGIIQIAIWVVGGVGVVSFWLLKRRDKSPAETSPPQHNAEVHGSGSVAQGDDAMAVSGGSVGVRGNVSGGVNIFNASSDQPDRQALRQRYLVHVYETAEYMALGGIDPKVASDEAGSGMRLEAVYTALLTLSPEADEQMRRGDLLERRIRYQSALAQLNAHDRLVLLGDPGSGKSTFVNFVTMCMAGELLH